MDNRVAVIFKVDSYDIRNELRSLLLHYKNESIQQHFYKHAMSLLDELREYQDDDNTMRNMSKSLEVYKKEL